MNKFILSKEDDPRCIEYYQSAFPELNKGQQEVLRVTWINRMVKMVN